MKNLTYPKPNAKTAVLTAVFHVFLFYIGIFGYLTLGESSLIFLLIVGISLFLVSMHIGVVGKTFKLFQKVVLIRVLIWWLTGGVVINIVNLLIERIG